jgi:hypothetical protein
MDNRVRNLVALAAIAVALLLGVVLGMSTGIADRLFGGPNPKTIATASLESMRAENRLIAFVARYVSVTTSTESQFGFSAKRTLILPGDVRYEVDLSKLQPGDVTWDASTKTLHVKVPEVEIAGPDVDLAAAQEYGSGGVLSALTDANQSLDSANRAKAVADLRKQAGAPVPMRLAHQAARQAIERSFAMPLLAAGFKDVKVLVRFPTEGTDDPSYLDLSTPYEEAIREAERRRAAEGQK